MRGIQAMIVRPGVMVVVRPTENAVLIVVTVIASDGRAHRGRRTQATDADHVQRGHVLKDHVQKAAVVGHHNDTKTNAGLRRPLPLPCLLKSRFSLRTRVSRRWWKR